ncbi:Gfo/Idh/MocA family protein [Oryzihumus sp.]
MKRVVIRGAGSIGRRHARVFARLGTEVLLWPVRERAGQDVDAESGASLLSDRDAADVCSSADLVVVATDTGRHVADALAALDTGCPKLLLEKPVAPTLSDVDPLLAHPRAEDVWVAAPLRAHQGFRELRRRCSDVGRPASAHVWSQSWLPDWRPDRDYRDSYSARADEGGVLRDLVHEIDYATVLFGAPERLAARLDVSGPLEMAAEQAATLLWRAPDATTVTVRLDYITRPARRGLELNGPDGSLRWDVMAGTLRRVGADGSTTRWDFPDDLDRDVVMGTQAVAALGLHPGDDPEVLRDAGAPATLTEGCLAVRICDDARTADAAARRTTSSPLSPIPAATAPEGLT